MSNASHSFPEAIVALFLRLREFGIDDHDFLRMVESVPHEQFVPVQHFEQAWKNQSLPIDCGQTMMSPDITIRLVDALKVESHHAVLEIGTGTGYLTALLARQAKKVYSVDRYRGLIRAARDRLEHLGLTNATFVQADGRGGQMGQGLYDRIIIDSAFETMPRYLLDQLVSGGVVITAIGPAQGVQMLVRLTKIGSRFDRADLFPVHFGQLEEGLAAAL